MNTNEKRAKKIGETVLQYRADYLEKTQEEFIKYVEDETGVSINRSTLSLIENGTQEPNLDMLIALSEAMGIQLSELLEITEEKYVIIDTSIILKRPKILDELHPVCDKIYIPDVVIEELNYQKDHGESEQKKISASLCMSIIDEIKKTDKDKFCICEPCPDGKINDDKIFELALKIAKQNRSDIVYLLTTDKYFSLKNAGKIKNLKVIYPKDFHLIFRKESLYNDKLSNKFYVAVMKKNMESAKALSEKNVNVNLVDKASGFTPLIRAVKNKDYDMTEFLLSLKQIDINAVDNHKHCLPPISHAIQIGNKEVVELLINNGANVNEPSRSKTNPYNTPLMIAAWEGHLDIVELLVKNGACINQVDKGNGFTALIKAVFNNRSANHSAIVKYLLEHNADKTICSFEAKTALDIAKEKNSGNKYKEIIELLDERGNG